MSTIKFQLTSARAWVVGLATAVVAIIELLIVSKWTSGTVQTVGQNVGATILSIGLITVAYDIFIRRTYTKELLELVQLSEHLTTAGILQIGHEPDIDWGTFLRRGREFTFLLVEAAAFAEREWQHVLDASRERATIVRVFLPNPDSQAIPLLADHLSQTPDELAATLRRTRSNLENSWMNARTSTPPLHKESRLQIFHYDRMVAYGLLCVDQRAIVVAGPASGKQPGHGPLALLFNLEATGAAPPWLANQRRQLVDTEEVPVYDG